MPFDERKLNYKLSQVGLTQQKWDREGLLFLNARQDIAPRDATAALYAGGELPPDTLLLGNAWYAREGGDEATFRWADTPEVLVHGRTAALLTLRIEVEARPLADGPATLSLLDRDGRVLGSAPVRNGRDTVAFALPPGNGGDAAYRLQCDTPLLAADRDTRPLRFRVFSLSLAAGNPTAAAKVP